MIFYRLRHPDGQYARGGLYPNKFSRQGKIWLGKAPFTRHLAQYSDPLKFYKECVLVVIDEEAQTFTETHFLSWWTEYSAEKERKAQIARDKKKSKRSWDAIEKGLGR